MGLNNSVIMGRITNDLELKYTPSKIAVLSFTVAVNRSYAKQGEERQADFIDCVAWRAQAEFISKYFAKGRMIAIQSELRTRTYEDKNGSKHKVTELYVNNVDFTGESKPAGQQGAATNAQQPTGQQPAGDVIDFADFEEVLTDDGVPF